MMETQEKVNSFILYTEQWPAISLLNDVQRSTLMQAIFALHGACTMPELDDMTKAIFLLMKPRFEENRDRYATKCEANRENGKKGGRPRKNKNQTVNYENPKTERFLDENPNTLTDSYTDSDSDPDPDFKTPPPLTEGQGGGESAFAHEEEKPTPRELGTNPRAQVETSYPDMAFVQFLDAYPPEKRDEGAAWQAWLTLSRAKQLPGLPKLLDAVTAWENSEQWQKDNGQYIPLASNFLSKRRFLDTPPSARLLLTSLILSALPRPLSNGKTGTKRQGVHDERRYFFWHDEKYLRCLQQACPFRLFAVRHVGLGKSESCPG